MRRLLGISVAIGVLATACSGADPDPGTTAEANAEAAEEPQESASPDAGGGAVSSEGLPLPAAPAVPSGPPADALTGELDGLFTAIEEGRFDPDAIRPLGSHEDARVGWVLADLLRFVRPGDASAIIGGVFADLTGVDLRTAGEASIWKEVSDHLIAWDLPAFDGYVGYKERLFTLFEPGWRPFFADDESLIDWRFVSWGGVFIDDRPLGSPLGCSRGCIPALDDPPVTGAEDGDWYPDDAVVFGVVVNGEARAYPKNMMEVHEMVNDTLGDRRIGLPYCTLCGSAQVYFTDDVPDGVEVPVLRTSGLLTRSNKVMYDVVTSSVFDTFRGEALSGPLREAGVVLEQGTVVASTWGAWKEGHPDTTIIASDGGLGRVYELDPLGGRDDDGPIFPVGDVDGRLDVQATVVGVIAPDGTPVAFPSDQARLALEQGGSVESQGLSLELDGDGLRAFAVDGAEVPAHQAFWFAWSQFYPETEVWAEGD